MILPRRLLLLPLISSVLVTHAEAADAGGKSAPAPTTSTVAPKEKSPAVTAEDFGRFAPLYTALASDPANKSELDFMIASKNRILGNGGPRRHLPTPPAFHRQSPAAPHHRQRDLRRARRQETETGRDDRRRSGVDARRRKLRRARKKAAFRS